MKITVAATREEFDTTVARRITDRICRCPRSVIGLSTGRTTGNIHREVCRIHSQLNFDVTRVTFFGLDEVTGVDREYSGACYKMLKTEIIDGLGIPSENFLMLPTRSADFAAECRRFTDELDARGGIDLLVLGLGENGHLGFNQPGAALNGTACTASMDSRLEERIRRETGSAPDAPLGGVTLGIRDIMHARRLVLAANGSHKAETVRQMLCGPVSPELPASVLQLHPDCEFILDSEAAALIDVEQLRKN
ncbi:MAG: glucosamine-6-phosphate deaminase [Muribaculaceae bacterium]|nr:glucosamine-6-phosphate deaminase [Muribaculaceae bacterium]